MEMKSGVALLFFFCYTDKTRRDHGSPAVLSWTGRSEPSTFDQVEYPYAENEERDAASGWERLRTCSDRRSPRRVLSDKAVAFELSVNFL